MAIIIDQGISNTEPYTYRGNNLRYVFFLLKRYYQLSND